MDQGENARPGAGYSQYAYCPRAGLAAGKDSLFHSGRRCHQGSGPELQGKASGVIMGILLTQQAADHINRYIEKRGKGLGLRLGVRTTGCSGMAYKLEYVYEPNADEIGRASCRGRVCMYVSCSVVAVSLKTKQTSTNQNTMKIINKYT